MQIRSVQVLITSQSFSDRFTGQLPVKLRMRAVVLMTASLATLFMQNVRMFVHKVVIDVA